MDPVAPPAPMAGGITVTLDLEDHRPDLRHPIRYERTVREQVLPLLADLGATATVFVVGTLAERSPRLIADIAAAGHEIALHGWDHEQLDRVDAAGLAVLLERGISTLGALAGTRPVGYRAPSFSMTAVTARWAPDVVAAAGFRYSSSVVPAANPIYGLPGAPTQPFRWPGGLLELPVPLVRPGARRLGHRAPALPFGGTYLRLLPAAVLRETADRLACGPPGSWLYFHAYDLDVGEPFWWEPVAGRLAPLLWVGRRRLRDRLARLVDGIAAPPLREVAAALESAPLPCYAA